MKWRSPTFRDVVESSRGTVLIDTRYTFDGYYETMVFRCDKNGGVKDDDWIELDCERYPSIKDMRDGHQRMIGKWSVGGKYDRRVQK